MDIPTFLKYTARQDMVKQMIEEIINFQLSLHVANGVIDEEQAANYTIDMTQISTQGLETVATAMQKVSASLLVAETEGWITKEEARAVYAVYVERSGVELSDQVEVEDDDGGMGSNMPETRKLQIAKKRMTMV